tara:strand:- start:149 stop:724 length:576 start_codon:yes stop_codon:yes gene_type:complete
MKKLLAGVDEVGRGSLVGPVYAAAVIFNKKIKKKEFKDSKRINKNKRENLAKYIMKNSIWSIGIASLQEIEKINILNASLLAMKRAIKKLKVKPKLVLVDGNKSPKIQNYLIKNVIKGDQKIKEISAASIIAKVLRDKLMSKLSKKYKKYKWDLNAGYGTKEHIRLIKKYGITKFHRKKFKPIHNILSHKK